MINLLYEPLWTLVHLRSTKLWRVHPQEFSYIIGTRSSYRVCKSHHLSIVLGRHVLSQQIYRSPKIYHSNILDWRVIRNMRRNLFSLGRNFILHLGRNLLILLVISFFSRISLSVRHNLEIIIGKH